MAGFILNGGEESKVILLSVMVVVTSEWIFTRTSLLSYVLANSFLGFSMRDNLRHVVFATLLIIWRRIARTPFASTVTVLVTYPNNVLPKSNAVYVTKPCIDCQLSWSWRLPSHRSPDPEPAVVFVENHSSDDTESVTPDNDLSSVMDVHDVQKMVMFLLQFRMFVMMMMMMPMIMMILVVMMMMMLMMMMMMLMLIMMMMMMLMIMMILVVMMMMMLMMMMMMMMMMMPVLMMMMLMLIMIMMMLLLTMIMTWMTVIPVMKLLPVCMLITMSLRRIPSWSQGNDPEKMTILLTCSVNLRALKIPDHFSPCKSLRYLLYHLLKRLLNLLPLEFVLLMFDD